MSPMGYDRVSSPLDCLTYEENVETIMNLEMVIESVMLMAKNFVDIPVQNNDVDEELTHPYLVANMKSHPHYIKN